MNLLDFIFPKRCVGCGKIGSYFCTKCRVQIRPILDNERICPMCGRLALDGITHPRCRTSYSLDGLTSFFHYDGPVKKAIKAIKYRLVFDLAEEFVSLIPHVSTTYDLRSILVPIPLHPTRRKERGFNQAEILARHLPAGEAGLHIPMRTDILRRIRATPPQAEIKEKKKRLENMKQSFVSNNISGISENILLFDDVCTTGATLRNAAAALKRAGAKHIWAITIAR